jgi:hypothetical protein
MAELTDDGLGRISSNTDGEQELQHSAQTKQRISEGAEYVNFTASQQIRWQREVLAIVERISTCAEAIEGARALLTSLLEAQAGKQDHDPICSSLDCNLDPPSTLPLGQSVDQRNDLEAQAREQNCDRSRASPDCNADSPSTPPLGQPVDHRNGAIGSSGIARPCADRRPVQLEANLEYVWRLVRAAAAWFSELASRAGSRSGN